MQGLRVELRGWAKVPPRLQLVAAAERRAERGLQLHACLPAPNLVLQRIPASTNWQCIPLGRAS